MHKIVKQLRSELYAKPAPGEILNNIMEESLKEMSSNYKHDEFSLWVGAYLSDMFISEAKNIGDLNKHVPMALEYAKTFLTKEKVSIKKQEIVLEIISTHHGGEQKHIESKLYKNADCMKFLEPKGVFHIFGTFYKGNEKTFAEAMRYTIYKVEEKYRLVDLDDDLKRKAKALYDHWQWFFQQMPYKLETPKLYK